VLVVLISVLELPIGGLLFAQGGTDSKLYIVVSGILQISEKAGPSGERTVGFIGAGDYVGEVSLLTGAPYAGSGHSPQPLQALRARMQGYKAVAGSEFRPDRRI
jgi:hypothetical protein